MSPGATRGGPIGTGAAEHFAKRVNAAKLPGHLMAEVAPLLVVMQHLNAQIAFLDGWLERVVLQDTQVANLGRSWRCQQQPEQCALPHEVCRG